MGRSWLIAIGSLLISSAMVQAQEVKILAIRPIPADKPAAPPAVSAVAPAVSPPSAPIASPAGYLVETSAILEAVKPAQLTPYVPRPGDLILYRDNSKFFNTLYKWARTEPPTHVAMVIRGRDGRAVLLELNGPTTISATVKIMEVEPRMSSYDGDVAVRRIREPLTEEQMDILIDFAEAQDGKKFALGRTCLMVTPFSPRDGVRRSVFGRTYYDRNRWICSELITTALAKSRILDPQTTKANATFPRDYATEDRLILSTTHHPAIPWSHKTQIAPSKGPSNEWYLGASAQAQR